MTLPGAKLGGTSNAGGTAQLAFEANDHTSVDAKSLGTGLRGVFLQPSPEGSGTVFCLGEDVFLEQGIHITALVARGAEKSR